MRPRYCTAFHAFTASASSEAPEHPAANVQTHARWRRTWRTADATPVRLVLELTDGEAEIAAIYLHHLNFAGVTLSTSANGSDWSDVGPYDTVLDEELGRRKLLITDTITTAFVGLTPIDVSGDYAEVGGVSLCQVLTEMGQGPERPGRGIVQDVPALRYPGGGFETNTLGPKRVALSMSGRWIEERCGADLQAIIRAGKDTPLLVDEGDHASHVALVQLQNDPGWERSFKLREGLTFTFEECL